MILLIGLWWALAVPPGFAERQAKSARVQAARANKGDAIAALFAAVQVTYPPQRLYLRAFKVERELQVWVGEREGPMRHLKTYPVCATSGTLGPKRRMGDMQVPEGFYVIDRFNPWSSFHLSLGVSYPNASDRLLKTAANAGGDIFIHGDCVTIGCLPIEDEPIEELYVMTLDTYLKGREIPLHIFPRRLDDAGMRILQTVAGEDAELWRFWQSLVPAYQAFETAKQVPKISIDGRGQYLVR